MSSSFRERSRGKPRQSCGDRDPVNSIRARVLFAALMGAPPLYAANVYVQPNATLTVEGDTNLDMQPGVKTRTEGNLATAAALIGISTPDSDSAVRPRVEYRNYPEDSQDNRLEEYLDFSSSMRGARSSSSVYGSLQHRDEFNAEQNSALYDSLFPVAPTSPQTGRAVIGATRDSALVVPAYNFRFSPVLGAGVSGVYQRLNYSPNDPVAHVDFAYYFGKASMTWSFSQRSELSLGGFGSKYEATRFQSNANGTGATVDLDTSWTPLLSTTLSTVYQHTNVNTTIPTPLITTSNAWGATASVAYKTQISQWRLNAGRLITPSGAGALFTVDQIKTQYDRDLSRRLSVTGAVIALKNHALVSNEVGNNRTYVQTVVELKWMMAPTWYLQGGYQYMWEKYDVELSGAANTRVYFRVGYLGLAPQR
jgi:hypothetical protein